MRRLEVVEARASSSSEPAPTAPPVALSPLHITRESSYGGHRTSEVAACEVLARRDGLRALASKSTSTRRRTSTRPTARRPRLTAGDGTRDLARPVRAALRARARLLLLHLPQQSHLTILMRRGGRLRLEQQLHDASRTRPRRSSTQIVERPGATAPAKRGTQVPREERLLRRPLRPCAARYSWASPRHVAASPPSDASPTPRVA